jgi:hypothetical protein
LEEKAAETNSGLKALQCRVSGNCSGVKGATSVGVQETSKDSDWNVAHSAGQMRKRYSDVVADRQGTFSYYNKMYKLFIKSKNNQSALYTRTLLKSKVEQLK